MDIAAQVTMVHVSAYHVLCLCGIGVCLSNAPGDSSIEGAKNSISDILSGVLL